MQDFFYKPKTGDEIFFLPNVFLLEDDNIIKKMSNKVMILCQYLTIKKDDDTWSFFTKDYNINGCDILYQNIKKESYNNIELRGFIYGGISYLSFVQVNGDVKIFKFGRSIMEMLIKHYEQDIVGYNCKKFVFNISQVSGGFKNYDKCYFTNETYPIMFSSPKDYIEHIEMSGVKKVLDSFINKNLISKNYMKLKNDLRLYNLEHLMNIPELIKLERLEKIKHLDLF